MNEDKDNQSLYRKHGEMPAAPRVPDDKDIISWSASEFILHKKGAKWYAIYFGVTLFIAALVYLLTRDLISSGFIFVALALLAVAAAHPPRELTYVLTEHGIQIGQKFYLYNDFRSFAVIDEGAFSSITLLPLKRFAQAINIYYDPKDEEHIVGVFSQLLPIEERKLDLLDQFLRQIRF